jgi:hypothetical protein
MPIYELTNDRIRAIAETRFSEAGVSERGDLQRLLRDQVEIVSPDTLVIAEEFGEWEESRRRIDLLGLDKDANLVVIELKRSEDGGHMELQAIRYAAMVSAMTFDNVVEVFGRYLRGHGREEDPRAVVLEFLEWDEPDEDEFGQDVRIVLASAEFSKELTTAVMWLNEREVDIRCIRLKPYRDSDRLLLDVQQIIPLPEAEEYRVQLKEKQKRERVARRSSTRTQKYDVTIEGKQFQRLTKRLAIFKVVKRLCSCGAKPESLAELVPWRRSTMFRSVEGDVGPDEFIRLAGEKAKKEGKTFDPRRYFVGEGELIVCEGRTYAFTNQWGPRTPDAMDLLIGAYPDASVGYEKSPS